MAYKKMLLDRLIAVGYNTEGHCYFWYLENMTTSQMQREIKKIQKKA